MVRIGTQSLRLRVLGLAAFTIVAALALGGITLVTIFERHLERRVEQELAIRLLELARGFALDAAGAPVVTNVFADPRYENPYSGSYWQVSDSTGPVLRSRSSWDQTIDDSTVPSSGGRAFEVAGPNGSTLYVLGRDVVLAFQDTKHTYRLAVALDHAELIELRASFTTDVMRALGAIAAVLIFGAWLQIRLGLRPLRVLQEQLGQIQQGRAVRLTGALPDEIRPLAANLNALIDRQEETVQRARVRAGDLAHGLKTPLTILGAEARKLDSAGQHDAAKTLREQIGFMRAHVERELARARTHGASVAGAASTDVATSIERLLGLMRRMPRSENLIWQNDVPLGLHIRMDPSDFGEIAGNLLDNARGWARAGVRVWAEADAGHVRIVIDDDGPGIALEARARMRERGESGAAPGQGSGLGLAIVGDVLGQYQTSLEIDASPSGGCRMAFELPGWIERAAAE